ncbi:hypothetical protein ACFP3U_25625, partial [Kitasatospora misakiensis]
MTPLLGRSAQMRRVATSSAAARPLSEAIALSTRLGVSRPGQAGRLHSRARSPPRLITAKCQGGG